MDEKVSSFRNKGTWLRILLLTVFILDKSSLAVAETNIPYNNPDAVAVKGQLQPGTKSIRESVANGSFSTKNLFSVLQKWIRQKFSANEKTKISKSDLLKKALKSVRQNLSTKLAQIRKLEADKSMSDNRESNILHPDNDGDRSDRLHAIHQGYGDHMSMFKRRNAVFKRYKPHTAVSTKALPGKMQHGAIKREDADVDEDQNVEKRNYDIFATYKKREESSPEEDDKRDLYHGLYKRWIPSNDQDDVDGMGRQELLDAIMDMTSNYNTDEFYKRGGMAEPRLPAYGLY